MKKQPFKNCPSKSVSRSFHNPHLFVEGACSQSSYSEEERQRGEKKNKRAEIRITSSLSSPISQLDGRVHNSPGKQDEYLPQQGRR